MFKLRPTSNKVKEAIFNIMRDSLFKSKVLELYAGTGAFSLEIIKLGAESCILIEKDKTASKMIKEKAKKLGILHKVKVVQREALWTLKKLKGKKFNIIFMDPPYESGEYFKILETIDKEKLLEINGKVIVEHYHKKELPEKVGDLVLVDSRKYGQTKVSFFS